MSFHTELTDGGTMVPVEMLEFPIMRDKFGQPIEDPNTGEPKLKYLKSYERTIQFVRENPDVIGYIREFEDLMFPGVKRK